MNAKMFGAPWCANCGSTKKFLESKGIPVVEMTGADQVIDHGVLYINTDQFMEHAQRDTIRSLPTMITESGERLVGSQKIIEYVNSQSN